MDFTRVFAIDIMTCPHRQGAMRVTAVATEADDIRAVLAAVPRARTTAAVGACLSSISPPLEHENDVVDWEEFVGWWGSR